MTFIIKKLDEEDLESALLAAQECVIDLAQDPWYCAEWKDINNYKNIFFNKDEFDTFIAKTSFVVGFIMGKEFDKQIYDIRHHYVLKNYRQQGIAKKLKMYLTEYSQSLNYSEIHSSVSKGNTASIRLNRALGWEEHEDEEGYLYIKKLSIEPQKIFVPAEIITLIP